MSGVNALDREIKKKKKSFTGSRQYFYLEAFCRAETSLPFSHPMREYLEFWFVGQTNSGSR